MIWIAALYLLGSGQMYICYKDGQERNGADLAWWELLICLALWPILTIIMLVLYITQMWKPK